MKIPFDIKYKPQIESGEYKVETEEGSPARIICWDSPIDKERPIIAIVFDDQIEQYKADGRYDNDYETSNYDLFIITPEPEMTAFEKKVYAYCDGKTVGEELIKRIAKELLDLARKELEGDLKEKVIHDYWKQASDQCAQAREEGRKEDLKDLPRWRKWEDGACGNGRGIPIAIVKRGLNGYELVDALGIQGEQYITLSDLEKLPKED